MQTGKNNYDLIKFEDGEFSLDVSVSPIEDTVWLTANQMAILFNVQRPAILKHISNILSSKELDISTCSFLEQVQMEGNRLIKRKIKYYNLDMIISVGYRVNSKRGILFRKRATSVLKQYMLNGYSINEKRCFAHSD
ncbi:MAG: virulence RhuM family protein, partial [Anaeroplasmataceae bacterium]|nr:virulence RhuM family protein [Anaeroplasmataceae bacterium]